MTLYTWVHDPIILSNDPIFKGRETPSTNLPTNLAITSPCSTGACVPETLRHYGGGVVFARRVLPFTLTYAWKFNQPGGLSGLVQGLNLFTPPICWFDFALGRPL